jgi:nucleoside-diphosphate-sugar epimerase
MSGYSGREVLVTGAAGFIGAQVVQRLIEEGANVCALARNPSAVGRLSRFRDDLKYLEADLVNMAEATLDEIRPEFVFHLAAYGAEPPSDSLDRAVQVNIQGTCNLLKALSGEGGARLQGMVYTGSDFEYGEGEGPRAEDGVPNPTNYYAASKASGWMFCRAFRALNNLPIAGVRPFLTYGPNQGTRRFVPYVILSALSGRPEIPLTGGRQVRDFVYISDIVGGLLKAAQIPAAYGEMINLGTGVGTSLRTVVDLVIQLTASSTRPLYGTIPYRKGEIGELKADIDKALRVLNWSPRVELEEGLRMTIDWYRSHLPELVES